MNKVSKIFQPVSVIPKNAVVKNQDITSKSQRLMFDLGFLKPNNHGSFHILPVLQKSLENCIKLIDENMKKIGAQKVSLPILTPSELWKKSGRLNSAATELMTTKDRHGKIQILSPTHEESITSLLSSVSPISYRQLPLRLYQIGPKFRDELKPRFGLMRAKEFLMKDLYTFDGNSKDALNTYEEVNQAYEKIFNSIKVPFVKVKGDTGTIGGSISHEFHFPSSVGEDQIIHCSSCNYATNKELCGSIENCPECKKSTIEFKQGIEVGHTFLLEDKYSKLLGANVLQSTGKPSPLIMGCYGIGVTRLIAASIEVLSSESEIVWPFILAPYRVCVITPKEGSKEELAGSQWTEKIYENLNSLNGLKDSVVLDDRTNLTIGKRFMEAKRMGYPMIVILGAKVIEDEPKFEFHDTAGKRQLDLSYSELLLEVEKTVKDKSGEE